MPPTRNYPNQPGGQLAERLRLLRTSAGLTGNELAAAANWSSTSKVSKIEGGQTLASEDDIQAWTRICGAPDAADELIELRNAAQIIRQEWRHKLRAGQAALQREYETLVRNATIIRNFEILLIPGLLQTPDYTRYRALEAVRVHGAAEDGVEATVAARMRRGEILYDSSKTFQFVITDAALHYLLCPPAVMLGQLDRLAVTARLPNVSLGIIPSGVELPVAPMIGYIMVDDQTLLETFTAMEVYTGTEAAKYAEIFAALMAESATGEDAQQLIAGATQALRLPPNSASED